MFKRKRVSILVTVLIVVILAGLVLYSALAFDPDGSYMVLLRYYDRVQINYRVVYSDGRAPFNGPEDIPIGGVGQYTLTPSPGTPNTATIEELIIRQAYCIDPFTSFTHYADGTAPSLGPLATDDLGHAWGPTTAHWKDGYEPAVPWVMSEILQKYYDEVMWITYNGYRGDFRWGDNTQLPDEDNTENSDSIDRLKGLYPDLSLEYEDKDVAVMATKVAIWRILTDDFPGAFTLNSTVFQTGMPYLGLAPDPDKQAKFEDLLKYLLRDARAGRDTSGFHPEHTALTVNINGANLMAPPGVSNSNYDYFGPLPVTATLEHAAEIDTHPIDMFFTARGPFSMDVRFVTITGSTITEMPGKPLPGTAITNAQHVSGDIVGGSYARGDVYVRVPKNRVNFLAPGSAGSELLTIRAMAVAQNVKMAAGTPVPVVAAPGGGSQDWHAVQAFIGALALDTVMTVYGDAGVFVDYEFNSKLTIRKEITAPTHVDENEVFTFALYFSNHDDFNNATQVNLEAFNVTPASSRVGTTNTFTIKHGETVEFLNLPSHVHYWIVELDAGMSGFSAPRYAVTGGKPEAGITFPATAVSSRPVINGYRTCYFDLDPDAEVVLTMTNRRERAVQTGDDRDMTIPIILLSVGVVLIVAAEVYRRKKKKAKKGKE